MEDKCVPPRMQAPPVCNQPVTRAPRAAKRCSMLSDEGDDRGACAQRSSGRLCGGGGGGGTVTGVPLAPRGTF
ncbi:hypothetical protein EON67_11075 [archaeon]|nr:MAG: hypothetical protein EON67_11075 [archaeon]